MINASAEVAVDVGARNNEYTINLINCLHINYMGARSIHISSGWKFYSCATNNSSGIVNFQIIKKIMNSFHQCTYFPWVMKNHEGISLPIGR